MMSGGEKTFVVDKCNLGGGNHYVCSEVNGASETAIVGIGADDGIDHIVIASSERRYCTALGISRDLSCQRSDATAEKAVALFKRPETLTEARKTQEKVFAAAVRILDLAKERPQEYGVECSTMVFSSGIPQDTVSAFSLAGDGIKRVLTIDRTAFLAAADGAEFGITPAQLKQLDAKVAALEADERISFSQLINGKRIPRKRAAEKAAPQP